MNRLLYMLKLILYTTLSQYQVQWQFLLFLSKNKHIATVAMDNITEDYKDNIVGKNTYWKPKSMYFVFILVADVRSYSLYSRC